ncbi:hypothetical protein VNI00_011186 [Paramarasmius palmivorus]|uniref:Uncharacterized protein n=1 Tax=Paramarasmius palmivorus TaxID=297713 RepID=A0AAW0CD79_9AGAR
MPEVIELHGHGFYLTLVLLSYLQMLYVTAIFADRSLSQQSDGSSEDEDDGCSDVSNVDTRVVEVNQENLVYRHVGGNGGSYCVWPDEDICPALSNGSGTEEFIKEDLRLCNIHYHQRILILQFTSHRYLLVRPLLHSSPNLYTRDQWVTKVAKVPSRDRGFKILVALRFGDSYVLSFNSNDCLGMVRWMRGASSLNSFPVLSPLCTPSQSSTFYKQVLGRVQPDSPSIFTESYSVWLQRLIHWIRGCTTRPKVSIFLAIKDDQDAFDGCGAYMTSVVLACAGLRPWQAAVDVASCPARVARLAEAMFEVVYRGHKSNIPRIRRAWAYNGVSLSATEDDILEYGPHLHVYAHNKYTVSTDMKQELSRIERDHDNENDVFHAPFFTSCDLPGHLGPLIRGTLAQEAKDPLTKFFKYSCPFVYIDKRPHATPLILSSTKLRKVPISVHAYQVGTGSKPPVAWSLYTNPLNKKRWIHLLPSKQDEKTLEFVKRLTEKFLAGPLDFCGVSRVTRHGNGYHVWTIDPKSKTYRSHPSYPTSYAVAIQGAPSIYVQHRESEVKRKKKLRANKAKCIKLQQWEPGIYRYRSYTTQATAKTKGKRGNGVNAVRLTKTLPYKNVALRRWVVEMKTTWKRMSEDRKVILQGL